MRARLWKGKRGATRVATLSILGLFAAGSLGTAAGADSSWASFCSSGPVRDCAVGSGAPDAFYVSSQYFNGGKCYLTVPSISSGGNLVQCLRVAESELGAQQAFIFGQPSVDDIQRNKRGQAVQLRSVYYDLMRQSSALAREIIDPTAYNLSLLDRPSIPLDLGIGLTIQAETKSLETRWGYWFMERADRGLPMFTLHTIDCWRNSLGDCAQPIMLKLHPKGDKRDTVALAPNEKVPRVYAESQLHGIGASKFTLEPVRGFVWPSDLLLDEPERSQTRLPALNRTPAQMFATGARLGWTAVLTESGDSVYASDASKSKAVRLFPETFSPPVAAKVTRPAPTGLTYDKGQDNFVFRTQTAQPMQLVTFKPAEHAGSRIKQIDPDGDWRVVEPGGTDSSILVEAQEDGTVKLRVVNVLGQVGAYLCRGGEPDANVLSGCGNSKGSSFRLTWVRKK